MNDPLGVSPSKGNQGTTRGKEKILLTSVGIEPTTSGLDLLLLCWLSYEVGQRKSGMIMVVNHGEEKVRVHMNVVLRGTTFICILIDLPDFVSNQVWFLPHYSRIAILKHFSDFVLQHVTKEVSGSQGLVDLCGYTFRLDMNPLLAWWVN